MLFRRYREFDELHRRLTLCFPGDDLPTFPRKTYLPGKSRARETVEKRMTELNVYIGQLLQMEPRISEVMLLLSGRPDTLSCNSVLINSQM